MTDDEYGLIFTTAAEIIERREDTRRKSVQAALISALDASRRDIIAECERLMGATGERFMEAPKGQLDRHKCAACFMIALLNKFDMASLEDNPLTPKLTRERIAIDIGQSILITMIRGGRAKNAEFIAFLDANGDKFMYPDTLCDEGDYFENWALSLYHCRVDGGLHVLSLSNTLFLIEAFNRERAAQMQDTLNTASEDSRFRPHI